MTLDEYYVAGGKFQALAGYESVMAVGAALLVRREGATDASVQVSGLTPNTAYPAHVHAAACANDAGGGHYKIDPAVADPIEQNEIWPAITTDEQGMARREVTVAHTARADALSIVIHDPAQAGAKMLCADLSLSTPKENFLTRGNGVLLPGASAFPNLSAEATMQRIVGAGTAVDLSVSGLGANQMYPVHVHDQACSSSNGGGHYKIDYNVMEAVETNELWVPITTNATGGARLQVTWTHIARAEAQSVVIHNNDMDGTRLVCIDLEYLPML
jgi:hypothetical protein